MLLTGLIISHHYCPTLSTKEFPKTSIKEKLMLCFLDTGVASGNSLITTTIGFRCNMRSVQ